MNNTPKTENPDDDKENNKYSKANAATATNCCEHHWLEGVNLKSKQFFISNGGNTLINRDNVLLPTQRTGLTTQDKQKINDACKDVSS